MHAWLQVHIDPQTPHFFCMHAHALLYTSHSIHIISTLANSQASFYISDIKSVPKPGFAWPCWLELVCAYAGAVQTLMSVDADRVVNLCVSLHELWSLPAQIAIALYLLYTQVGHHTSTHDAEQPMVQYLTSWYQSYHANSPF